MPDGAFAAPPIVRARLVASGAVQGVGFRPLVYRLATELGLAGIVRNTPAGVVIEVEGASDRVTAFADRLPREAPPPARVATLARRALPPSGETGFVIADSTGGGAGGALLLPDLATCPACVADALAPAGRHAGYAFTACATCGPRFSVTAALPYDRERTALAAFPLCPACARDHHDPANRRFHAQTQACPACGPTLSLLDRDGHRVAVGAATLSLAADRLRDGHIVAVKGIGGFHLLARADDERAIAALRARKRRPTKPFAVMFPTLAAVAEWCEASPAERSALTSAAAPIVLLRRAPRCAAAASVAPGNPRLGALLPYAPLHHLLMRELAMPVVATSANLSGEPLLFRDDVAEAGLADAILTHDRPILRPVEDSVVQLLGDAPMTLRLGRGLAPLALTLASPAPALLALGGRLKNAPAITAGDVALLGPELGDLDHPRTLAAHRELIADLCRMHRVSPRTVALDAHPDDTPPAGMAAIRVQHHLAHVAAVMAEHRLPGPVLGIAWDGAGYGADGTVWGGEFLLVDGARWRRVARLRPFRLPGGDAAAREPTRATAGALADLFGADPSAWPTDIVARLAEPRLPALLALCRAGHAAPLASSAGRLFDAVAALLGLCRRNSFEGEAAIALESRAADATDDTPGYGFALADGSPAELDWRPALRALLADLARDTPRPTIAARFHRGLIDGAVAVAARAGVRDVVLTGGCFQSHRLATRLPAALSSAGLTAYTSHLVPPGDGGLALGQLEWARRLMATG
jgi:hydrogenase maturation protein HypF